MASSDTDKLLEEVAVAKQDFRDVLIPAESPGFHRIGFVGIGKLSVEQQQNLIDRDWAQYSEWLYRE
jgi:hypothetical protein